ncbi:MAG: hypothetical protein AB7H80_00440, partial [Candidatus Kapaibacterium sp.]
MKFVRPLLLALLLLSCSNTEEKSIILLIPDSVFRSDQLTPTVPVISLESGCSEGEPYVEPKFIGSPLETYAMHDLVTGHLYTIESYDCWLLLRDGRELLDTVETMLRSRIVYGQTIETYDSLILVNEAVGRGNSAHGEAALISIVNGRFRLLAVLHHHGFNPLEAGTYTLDYKVHTNPIQVSCREEYSWSTRGSDGDFTGG